MVNAAAAPSGSLSVIIRHLPPATVNTFAVTAIDFTGRNSIGNGRRSLFGQDQVSTGSVATWSVVNMQ